MIRTPATRAPARRVDEDNACPDCGVPGGHPEHEITGLPRCPDNWTNRHLETVDQRAEKAYRRYEDAYGEIPDDDLDVLYGAFRHRADDAEAVHLVLYNGRGHSWWWCL
jgi:hypothetical protein